MPFQICSGITDHQLQLTEVRTFAYLFLQHLQRSVSLINNHLLKCQVLMFHRGAQWENLRSGYINAWAFCADGFLITVISHEASCDFRS